MTFSLLVHGRFPVHRQHALNRRRLVAVAPLGC